MMTWRGACRDAENQIEDLQWKIEELQGAVRDRKQERDEYRLALVTLKQMAKGGASVETLLAMVNFLNRVNTEGDDENE